MNNSLSEKRGLSAVKYFVLICAVALLYSIAAGFSTDTDAFYVLYLGDFSIGICTRMLLGQILSLFKDSFSIEWVSNFCRVSYVVIFAITAAYFASALSHADKKENKVLYIIMGIYLMSPFSISVYAGLFFGMIDIFAYLMLLFAVLAGNNKILIWLTPLLCVAGVFIHDCYILVYLAPCIAVQLYYVIKKYKKSTASVISLIVTILAGIASSVYSVIFATSTIKMTQEETIAYLAQKGNCAPSVVSGYIEQYLFHYDVSGKYVDGTGKNVWEMLKYMTIFAIESFGNDFYIKIILTLPVIAIFVFLWVYCIRKSKGFTEKLPYICFILTILPKFVAVVMSTDTERFLATFLITQVLYVLMCVKLKDKKLKEAICVLDKHSYWLFIPLASTLIANI